jgi:phenylalanyl-tRNA synthetase alpha chain
MYGKWKTQKFRKYDVTTPAPKIYPAKKQPYVQFIEDIRRKLMAMGFREMKGTFIETGFWNCDALFMPQDHPSRGIHDAFYMKHPAKGQLPDKNIVAKVKATQEGGWVTGSTGWGGEWSEEEAKKLMLRSQTTAVSARTLVEHGDKPGMFFNIDRVFRYDVIDAKHLVEFDQCEGIIIGENLTLRHLFGILKEFADMVGAKEVRYKPAYFPYTEPSCEVYMKFPKLGWVEMGGAGMFRPEVLRPLGIEKSNVLAWGFGLGRLAMMKLGIEDIRQLYSDDIDFLRNAPMVRL